LGFEEFAGLALEVFDRDFAIVDFLEKGALGDDAKPQIITGPIFIDPRCGIFLRAFRS